MRTTPGQVTDTAVRGTLVGGRRRLPPADSPVVARHRSPATAHLPVVTVRSAENPPQVPSGSLARIRTRYDTPGSRPM